MKKVFLPLLLFAGISSADFIVITDKKTSYPHQEAYYGVYIQDTFDDYDKALYLAEDLKLREDKLNKSDYFNVYIANTDKEHLKKNILIHHTKSCLTDLKNIDYPKTFNREVFLKDIDEVIKKISTEPLYQETRCVKGGKEKKKNKCVVIDRYKKKEFPLSIRCTESIKSFSEVLPFLKKVSGEEEVGKHLKEVIVELEKFKD